MKFSYKQLQTYFTDTLPTPEKLAEAVTFHAFEIESLEREGDDTIMDIKVLPDRACYAKSYEGVALEISAILGLKRDQFKIPAETGEIRTIPFHLHDITDVLGVPIPKEEVIDILESLGIHVDVIADGFAAKVPSNRLDLTHWCDLPEEIGRIYGYDKIPAKTPALIEVYPRGATSTPHAEFYYAEKIKNLLVVANFSEVYTYTLVPKGVYEMEKPLAADKNHLRTNLTDGISQSLELNARNADLLGLDEIKIF